MEVDTRESSTEMAKEERPQKLQQLSTTQCQVGFVTFLAFSPKAMTGSGGGGRSGAQSAVRTIGRKEALCWQVLLERVRGARV